MCVHTRSLFPIVAGSLLLERLAYRRCYLVCDIAYNEMTAFIVGVLMKLSSLLLALVAFCASSSFATGLIGTYEIPRPFDKDGGAVKVQLILNPEYSNSAHLSIASEKIDSTMFLLVADKFTMGTSAVSTVDEPWFEKWKVAVEDDAVTVSVDQLIEGKLHTQKWHGQFTFGLVGTYEFPPPEGVEGETTTIQLTKNEEDNYVASVSVLDMTIQTSNVIVDDGQFSFVTQSPLQTEDTSQTWRVLVANDGVTLSLTSDIEGKSHSMELKGKPVHEGMN